jgi:hypothetical protein
MKKWQILLISIACLWSAISFADDSSSVGLIRGFSGTDGSDGFGLTYKSYWGSLINFRNQWKLTGYWNSELDYWKDNNSLNTHYSNITIASLTPTLRFTRQFAYENGITPFIDAGYGVGVMNQQQFSDNQLGGYVTLRQTFGVGIQFGPQNQYDLAYHYVVFNNADILDHDDGLFMNTVEFDYYFSA